MKKQPLLSENLTKIPFLFWQPRTDFFCHFSSFTFGRRLLLLFNYIIWLFFFFISFLLIRSNQNTFWQIFFATLISEITEKYLKIKCFWYRPLCRHIDRLPKGFLRSWYQNGSFPSGHTIKATFFFLFILQSGVFPPSLFLLFTLPLLAFRVLTGFHYPVDVFGGSLLGLIIWFLVKNLQFPLVMISPITSIFNLLNHVF